ncbi:MULTISPECIES: FAD-dependent monooxygenase [unclassified Mesorhizobium]|uniref:NAD(P)/FAD-dependent oxidoreductase n=1 Tax=unclassified Mesorhizobium TaxID=325217 RepID=UPI00040C23D9|nr:MULTISPECIES: FAD-dependent monooxygenase [unclassified Mesorhizobium]WJI57236.1 tryptophan 7-halogenase [Mesorhizobium sp. C432A]
MNRGGRIVIVGAGPAGCSCALALGRLGFAVTLLNSERPAVWRAGEVCGPKLVQYISSTFGIALPSEAAYPLSHFHSCWGTPELAGHSYKFWSAGPAIVLIRSAFERVLLDAAKSIGVDVLEGYRASACGWDGHRWRLSGVCGDEEFELDADFVVEAVGPRTKSIVYTDVARLFFDDQVCLSFEANCANLQNEGALVESCSVGWWYACQTSLDCQIVCLFTDASLVSGVRRDQFVREQLSMTKFIRARAPWDCDTVIKVSSARTSARTLLWRGRWIPVGDAALSLDPVSGTGIERAVADGVAVAQAIATCADDGADTALRVYARQRAAAFQKALLKRRAIYRMERRWRGHPFWMSRSGLSCNGT